MFANDHLPLHLHAKYVEYDGVFDFEGNLVEGDLPNKQRKLVEAWILIHKEELQANWELLKNNEQPVKIEPLK
jgi:hypothetical protein